MIYIILFALLGALGFTVRGGLLNFPYTALGRLAWAVPPAIAASLFASNPWMLALAPASYLGAIFPWFGSLDLGSNEGGKFQDWLRMLFRGLLWTLPAGVVLGFITGAWWYAAVGLVCPVVYLACWEWVRLNPTRWAEAIFGAILGGALAVAIS